MEALKDAIIALFEADTWLAANVAGGIRYQEAGFEKQAVPYVAFYLSAGYVHHAGGQAEDWRIQFNVFSDQSGSSETSGILDHLVTAFNGGTLTVTGKTVGIKPMVELRELYKDAERKWQGVLVMRMAME